MTFQYKSKNRQSSVTNFWKCELSMADTVRYGWRWYSTCMSSQPNMPQLRRGQQLRPVGLSMVILQYSDLSRAGTGPYSQLAWSWPPRHPSSLPFLCQNQHGHIFEMDGRRTLVLRAHHHSWLQQLGPTPTLAPVPLTPYLPMPIAEATMTLLWHLAAIIIASVGFFLQFPKLRLTFFSTLFGEFGVHGPGFKIVLLLPHRDC